MDQVWVDSQQVMYWRGFRTVTRFKVIKDSRSTCTRIAMTLNFLFILSLCLAQPRTCTFAMLLVLAPRCYRAPQLHRMDVSGFIGKKMTVTTSTNPTLQADVHNIRMDCWYPVVRTKTYC